jgi:putative hydrolase of the HAD superfamily
MIRAFIFDIGNVILRFDFQHAMRKLERHCDPIAETVVELIEPIKVAYEAGRMERADFQAELRAILRYTGTDADFVAAWEDIFTENEPMIRLIETLEHYPLYLLSNTSDIHVDFFLRQYPVFGRFRDAVYSYKVRASKPDREIYEIAARQFGVDPAETFFIDDLAPNIASAAAVGFQTHHYHHERHDELLAKLKGLGVELKNAG